MAELADPARITIRTTVEWPDTDASGHYQNSVVMRWIQVAEAALHARLGIAERTFGSTPRVHVEADFKERLWFLDEVEVDFAVEALGRTSLRYAFRVRKGEAVAARGVVVCAYLPPEQERPAPWPEDLRRVLSEAGDVSRQPAGD